MRACWARLRSNHATGSRGVQAKMRAKTGNVGVGKPNVGAMQEDAAAATLGTYLVRLLFPATHARPSRRPVMSGEVQACHGIFQYIQ